MAADRPIVLGTIEVSKSFPGVHALRGISIDFRKGDVHAICGENGAGKSTLMQILAGVYMPDSGKIELDGKEVVIRNQKTANELGISMVYQERSLVPGLSVAENIFAARQPVKFGGRIDWKVLDLKSKDILSRLGLDLEPTAQVENLSPAMQQMVEIAKALSLTPRVLILDEPTSSITQKEIDALFTVIRKMALEGISIIYITHKIAEVFRIADRVSILKDGQHTGTEQVGNIDQEWIIKRMVGRDLYFRLEERTIGAPVVFECRDFSDDRHFRNVGFALRRGEILAFAGLTGAGRTELFRAVIGASPKKKGEVFLDGRKTRVSSPIEAVAMGIAYLPEDRKEDGLFLEMDIRMNMVSAALKRFQKGINLDERKVEKVAGQYVDGLSISTPSLKQEVLNLSGGNQQKVILAKWIITDAKVLIEAVLKPPQCGGGSSHG